MEQEESPAVAPKVPAGQSPHEFTEVCPVPWEAFPAAHRVHAVCPREEEYLPALHVVHVPPLTYPPIEQLTQVLPEPSEL